MILQYGIRTATVNHLTKKWNRRCIFNEDSYSVYTSSIHKCRRRYYSGRNFDFTFFTIAELGKWKISSPFSPGGLNLWKFFGILPSVISHPKTITLIVLHSELEFCWFWQNFAKLFFRESLTDFAHLQTSHPRCHRTHFWEMFNGWKPFELSGTQTDGLSIIDFHYVYVVTAY